MSIYRVEKVYECPKNRMLIRSMGLNDCPKDCIFLFYEYIGDGRTRAPKCLRRVVPKGHLNYSTGIRRVVCPFCELKKKEDE